MVISRDVSIGETSERMLMDEGLVMFEVWMVERGYIIVKRYSGLAINLVLKFTSN